MKFYVLAIASALALEIGLAGCAVSVPVGAKLEVTNHDNPEQVANVFVTVGPRRLLSILEKLITESSPRVELADSLLFRDAAFPQGGWELRQLLDPEQRNKITQKLQVDILVLVSPLTYTVNDADGFFVPLVAGAQSAEHKSSLSAIIYELNSGRALRKIDVSARGNEKVLYYVVVMAGTTPHVVTPTLEAMAKEIAKTVEDATSKKRVRIAVLATEDIQKQE